jgi:hypothetical protein
MLCHVCGIPRGVLSGIKVREGLPVSAEMVYISRDSLMSVIKSGVAVMGFDDCP